MFFLMLMLTPSELTCRSIFPIFLGMELNDIKVRDILETLRDTNSNVKRIIMSHHQFVDVDIQYFKDLWKYISINQHLYFLNIQNTQDLENHFSTIDVDNDAVITESEFLSNNQ